MRELFSSHSPTDISKDNDYQVEIELPQEQLRQIELIDTPGYNNNEADTQYARNALRNVAFAVFVITNARTPSSGELDMMREMSQMLEGRLCVLMNCLKTNPRLWLPAHQQNQKLVLTVEQQLESAGIEPLRISGKGVMPCNLLWKWIGCADWSESVRYMIDMDEAREDAFDSLSINHLRATDAEIARQSRFDEILAFFSEQAAIL